jgi:tRNA1(Val) A37 N6-methylase TrmN6
MRRAAAAKIERLPDADALRRRVASAVPREHKSALGQFMTPSSTARFMASLLSRGQHADCKLLDAGAGMGALTCALLDRWCSGEVDFGRVDVQAIELDEAIQPHLEASLAGCRRLAALHVDVVGADFIEWAVNALQFGSAGGFTHAILNPPYKKITSDSRYRLLLRQAGIETVNLYSAFVALALALLQDGGQLVAIIPRSFCNGPYYRPFREFVMERAAIRRIHLFASRNKAFRDDDVLQENVIVLLERGARQADVTVSTSADDTFADLESHEYPFHRIVLRGDAERFIHVPTSPERDRIEPLSSAMFSLADLGLQVSTGPVVDFRMREHLRKMPTSGTVPLLYSGHFANGRSKWPKPDSKKPNAIERNAETEKWLYPNGHYCVVRRFSSKEEPRRIVASVVDPATFGGASMLGFENHLNVFHDGRHGLTKELAEGLAAFLNTTVVDESFRRFNGHTQVNATDLRQMKYPKPDVLKALGNWAMQRGTPGQSELDEYFGTLAA